MATRAELSDFLAGFERRAYKQTAFAIRDDHAALDIVQDAMLRLSTHYGDRPAAELPLLFTRILQNATLDYHRRQKVRATWTVLFSALTPSDDDSTDPLDTLEAESDNPNGPEEQLQRAQVLKIIEAELAQLSPRQRQAFLLRYWEDFDVAETAAAMGCAEGSVKIHCSRATQALAKALRARGVTL